MKYKSRTKIVANIPTFNPPPPPPPPPPLCFFEENKSLLKLFYHVSPLKWQWWLYSFLVEDNHQFTCIVNVITLGDPVIQGARWSAATVLTQLSRNFPTSSPEVFKICAKLNNHWMCIQCILKHSIAIWRTHYGHNAFLLRTKLIILHEWYRFQ